MQQGGTAGASLAVKKMQPVAFSRHKEGEFCILGIIKKILKMDFIETGQAKSGIRQ